MGCGTTKVRDDDKRLGIGHKVVRALGRAMLAWSTSWPEGWDLLSVELPVGAIT